MTVIVRVQLLVLLVAGLVACGSADPETAERSSGSWERLPAELPALVDRAFAALREQVG
jgi:hypothetical protein